MRCFALVSVLALAACERGPAANEAAAPAANQSVSAANQAAPVASNASGNAAAEGEVASSRYEGPAVLRAFEAGDHLWARFDPIRGREAESTALVESIELAAFLNVHRGRPIEVTIETVNQHLDPPGERMDVTLLRGARAGGRGAEEWWTSLSPAEQEAARRDAEDLLSGGGG
ncbi:MAG TPA: hypothetical protein VEW25_08125 [Allosphingosinicella sp.]|nr:hypothetical protein [Allosphingosinicella sp.]